MNNVEFLIKNGLVEEFKALPASNIKCYFYEYLQCGISSNQWDIVSFLISGITPFKKIDILRHLLFNKQFEVFKKIFDLTGFINKKHEERMLLMVVANHYEELLPYLESKGIDFRINNDCALSSAISFSSFSHYKKRTYIVEFLLAKGLVIQKQPFSKIKRALSHNNTSLVKILLEHVLIYENNKKKMNNYLHLCCQFDYFDGALLLVEHGANPSIPLQYTTGKVKAYFLQELLEKKIPEKQKDKPLLKI